MVRGTGHHWEPREGSEQRRSKTPLTDYQEHDGGWVEGHWARWVAEQSRGEKMMPESRVVAVAVMSKSYLNIN